MFENSVFFVKFNKIQITGIQIIINEPHLKKIMPKNINSILCQLQIKCAQDKQRSFCGVKRIKSLYLAYKTQNLSINMYFDCKYVHIYGLINDYKYGLINEYKLSTKLVCNYPSYNDKCKGYKIEGI